MDVERICSNCDYFLYNQHCSLTGIPTELHQTCEMHQLRYEPIKKQAPVAKVFTGGIVFSIVGLLLKFWLSYERTEQKKSSDDMLKWAYEQQSISRAEIKLLHYMPVGDSLNRHKFVGVFFTDDIGYPEKQFKEAFPKFFSEIPFLGNNNDKIFVENKLYIRIDSSKLLISEISGQIEYVGGRKYFYEDEKLNIKLKKKLKQEKASNTKQKSKPTVRPLAPKGKGTSEK